MGTQVQEETLTLDEVLSALKVSHRLILWNDDTNTFEHVIHCLVKYLDYTDKQAERIAWTVHTDGLSVPLEPILKFNTISCDPFSTLASLEVVKS